MVKKNGIYTIQLTDILLKSSAVLAAVVCVTGRKEGSMFGVKQTK